MNKKLTILFSLLLFCLSFLPLVNAKIVECVRDDDCKDISGALSECSHEGKCLYTQTSNIKVSCPGDSCCNGDGPYYKKNYNSATGKCDNGLECCLVKALAIGSCKETCIPETSTSPLLIPGLIIGIIIIGMGVYKVIIK
jgi:hypothetical protein